MNTYNVLTILKEIKVGREVTTLTYIINDVENSITFAPGGFTYGDIVNAIITREYPNDKMQAIINNYLVEAEGSDEEFDEMLAFRATAKALAKEALMSDGEQL